MNYSTIISDRQAGGTRPQPGDRPLQIGLVVQHRGIDAAPAGARLEHHREPDLAHEPSRSLGASTAR